MGIKGLWTVLTPYSEKKSLHEIRGETLAVDLSGWICDSQNVTDYYIQPKLYLRNLFFRTIYLLLADITPIFVLEGDAPDLKQDVMAARNAIQFRGAAPKTNNTGNKKPDIARKRFKGVLKECENLLLCMGVHCVKGRGEAEATCAIMNAQGLVDAVVSQDSDCFAYGARRVYRNFSVSNSAGGGALQGSVDCYDAHKMAQQNGFGRNKMVALALLCGCDYGVGACGSSITTAVSFLHTVPDDQVISRLLSWVTDPEYYEERARFVSLPGRCDRCGHVGRKHLKNGCPMCATNSSCHDTKHKENVSEVKRELSLRTRALSCGMPFPEPKVMKEFLNSEPEVIDLDSLKAPAPSLIRFVKLMKFKLGWSERYCVEKFLPLLTKWHLQDNVPNRTIKPLKINKKRNPRGVPSYEIVWGDISGQYEALIPDDQFEAEEEPSFAWISTERQDLIRKYYPALVEEYEESIKKPPKEKKPRGRKKKDDDNSEDKLKRKCNKKAKNKKPFENDIVNLSNSIKKMDLTTNVTVNTSKLNVSVKVNKLKRKLKKGQKTIDSFIAKRRKSNKILRKSIKELSIINNVSINRDLSNIYISNNENPENKDLSDLISYNKNENKKDAINFLSMLENTAEDVCESDLSDIVDQIVKKAPKSTTAKLQSNLVRLIFEKHATPRKNSFRNVLKEQNKCSTPIQSPVRSNHNTAEKWRKNSAITNISRNLDISGNANRASINLTNISIPKVNTSYFFDKLTDDVDVFEMSVTEYDKDNIENQDCDKTVEYSLPVEISLPDVCL